MLIAIHAFDNMYGGYHGIEDFFITEVNSAREAYEEAANLSRQVIEDFVDVADFIEDFDPNDSEQVEELGIMIEEDIAYNVQEIVNENKINLYKTNDQALLNQFYNDADGFFLRYCNPIED